jgi:flagella basal body P-ring formation protein FlgA
MYRPMLSKLLPLTMVLLSAGTAWSEAVVQLKDEAFIKGPKVMLGDLVEVDEGLLSERLAEVEISPAALPGGSRNFSASLVAARMRTAGVKDVSVTGSPRVRATTLHIDISREMMAASLENHIELEMPWDPARTEIEIPFPGSDIRAPEGDMEIRWRANPQYKFIGPGAFRGEVLIDGEVYRRVSIRANIESYKEIVVAATDIPRGRPVMPSHLELEMTPISKMPRGAFTSFDEAVGLMARKTIFPGHPLTSRSVEAKRLVKRNQMVPVEVRNGRVHLQHRARAMMDGRAGDVIVCANPATKEEFQGRVRADGVVEVQR